MTKELGKEQKVLMARELEKAHRKRQRMQKYQFEIALGIASIVLIFVMMGMFMWIAHDAQRRWGGVTDTRYRDTLAAVQKQEWFERQQRLQEYEEFLEQRRRTAEQNESSR
jgi:choline-glycine betaine transporter